MQQDSADQSLVAANANDSNHIGNASVDGDDDGSSAGDGAAAATAANECEPKLKYSRLCNNVQTVLQQEALSCVTFNAKIICVGTRWGHVYVFDHLGNGTRIEHLRSHTVAVNQVSMDLAGEYVATCSDDGNAYAYGLYTQEHALHYSVGRAIRSVAVDPLYYKLGRHRRFVTGDERLLLHERAYFGAGLKTTVLFEAAGLVRNVKWYGRFIACACRENVRVYDVEERKAVGFIQWDQPAAAGAGGGVVDDGDADAPLRLDDYPCCFTWQNAHTLLVGWLNTFRICRVERRHSVLKESPLFMVNVTTTLRVDYFICGICPFDARQLAVLAYMRERDADGRPQRPRMYVFQQPADGGPHVEVSSDTLKLRAYHEYACRDYHLECLLDEQRFIVACPRDVIVASAYDDDDRVEWLVGLRRFDEAMELVRTRGRRLQRNAPLAVGRRYVDHLLARREYEKAGDVCAAVLGSGDKRLWENEVFKFARAGQLRAISRHLPVDLEHRLDPHIYEMVLYEYLKREPKEFLAIVRRWSPRLYNVHAVINAVLEHVVKDPSTKDVLLESLAALYSHSEQYDKALNVYFSLKHKGVFELIHKHRLRKNIAGEIGNLMELDAQQAVNLFLGKEGLPAELVVARLQHNQYHLYLYLDALYTHSATEARRYHPSLVRLYANFCPTKLLPLLRRSDNYPIHEALAICKERNLHAETVYLLARMGNTKEALQLLIKKIGDMEQAIVFCREHNDVELWEELVEHSLSKPEFVTFLLKKIGTYIDPRMLIRRIADNMEIPGLKSSLVKMLRDSSLQISIKEGCKNIVVSDCFALHKSLVEAHRRGYAVDDDLVCSVCHRKVLIKDNRHNVLMFYCRHSFHEECLPSIGGVEKCIVCSSQQGQETVT